MLVARGPMSQPSSPTAMDPRPASPTLLPSPRGGVSFRAYVATGDGLRETMVNRPASFTVRAILPNGEVIADRKAWRRGDPGGHEPPFTVTIRGPGAVKMGVADDLESGAYTITWVVKVSGEYSISICEKHGAHIDGSPFLATATVPHSSAQRCSLSGVGLQQAVAGEATRFRVNFCDHADRPVPPEPLDVLLLPSGHGTGGDGSLDDASDMAMAAGFSNGGLVIPTTGKSPTLNRSAALQQYAINQAGSYALHVRLRSSGESLPGSPFSVRVLPGAAHAQTTTLWPKGRKALDSAAGRPGKFSFHALDRLGNPCIEGGADVTAYVVAAECPYWDNHDQAARLGLRNVAIRDVGDGTYCITWHAAIRGSYRLAVRMRGVPIEGSPLPIRVRSGRPEPKMCTASGGGRHAIVAGQSVIMLVHCKDENGNPVDADPARTKLWIELRDSSGARGRSESPPTPPTAEAQSSEGGLASCEAAFTAEGVCRLKFVATAAGRFDIVVWCEHEGATYELLREMGALGVAPAAPTKARSSLFWLSKLQGATLPAGTKLRLPLVLKDSFGNVCEAMDNLVVTLVAEGNASQSSDPTAPEVLPPKILPRTVREDEKAKDSSSSSPAGAPLGSPRRSAVRAKLSFSNPSGSTPSEGKTRPKALLPSASTHVCEATMTLATTYQLSVTVGGMDLDGCPIRLQVCPGAASGSKSYLLPAPPMPAGLYETCEFRVQACDQHGNRLTKGGATVLCKAQGPGGASVAVADTHDGTCKARIGLSNQAPPLLVCESAHRLTLSHACSALARCPQTPSQPPRLPVESSRSPSRSTAGRCAGLLRNCRSAGTPRVALRRTVSPRHAAALKLPEAAKGCLVRNLRARSRRKRLARLCPSPQHVHRQCRFPNRRAYRACLRPPRRRCAH